MIKSFIYLTVFFFISLSAHADENEWQIYSLEKYVHATKNGEVTHGDDLRFYFKKGDCDIPYQSFTFYTYSKHPMLKSLSMVWVPVEINGEKKAARIGTVYPFALGHLVLFDMGGYDIETTLENFRNKNIYTVKLLDAGKTDKEYKAANFFDVRHNWYHVTGIADALKEAHKICISSKS